MQRLPGVGLGLVAALLAGCAAPANSPSATAGSVTATPVPPPEASAAPAAGTTAAAQPASGPSFLSVVGTPFLIAFKIPVCVISVAIAAPLAGLSELPSTAATQGGDLRQQLENGLAHNCGPPWVVTP